MKFFLKKKKKERTDFNIYQKNFSHSVAYGVKKIDDLRIYRTVLGYIIIKLSFIRLLSICERLYNNNTDMSPAVLCGTSSTYYVSIQTQLLCRQRFRATQNRPRPAVVVAGEDGRAIGSMP